MFRIEKEHAMRAGVAAVIFWALMIPWSQHPGFLPGAPALARDAGEGDSDAKMISTIHEGITLIAMYPPPGVVFDVTIVAPDEGLENLARALDLIRTQSPLGNSQIEMLKKSGGVFITYDPRHPDTRTNLATLQIAAFLPFYFDKETKKGAKNFLVAVGRHDIKWPSRELAGVLIHEMNWWDTAYSIWRTARRPCAWRTSNAKPSFTRKWRIRTSGSTNFPGK